MTVAERQRTGLKRLLWLYFWLLIFEGALRKWFLPQLSTPLLIVRDPLVVLIYFFAITRGFFPKSPFITATLVLAALDFFASFAGAGNLKVTLFGLHADFLHLPLIFLIPEIFDFEDVKQMGKWLLILSLPMALLALLQFRASPGAWINAAASSAAELGRQMPSAEGRIRPAGVFSFVTGMVSFLTLVAAVLSWHFADGKIYNRCLVGASMAAISVSLMLSGSRSAVATVAVVVAVLVLIGFMRGVASLSYVKYAAAFLLVFLVMSRIPVFHEGLVVHEERFRVGGGIHEGLIVRFFGELLDSFDACVTTPLLGLGLGVGTSAGAGILVGQREFLLSEGEWGRVICESGAVLGVAYIVLRFGIFFHILGASLKSFRGGYSLPLLLLGATGLDLLTGQFGQSAELGFVVFTCGLCLVPGSRSIPPQDRGSPRAEQSPGKIRGRSEYAEALHGGKPKDAA